MAGGRIFISYRHEDSRGEARALFDRLSARFRHQVFMDVRLVPGVDFVQKIIDEVSACDALIAVIGKHWLTASDANGHRRLDDPQDFVRLEVATALKRNIPVIPALVGGVAVPLAAALPVDLQALTRRQVLHLTDQGWDDDVMRLIRALESILLPAKTNEKAPLRRFWPWFAVAGLLICLVILIKASWPTKPKSHDNGAQIQSKIEQRQVTPVEEKHKSVIPPKASTDAYEQRSSSMFDPKTLSGVWRFAAAQAGTPGFGYDFMMYPSFEFSSIYQGIALYPKGIWQFRPSSKSLHFAADGLPKPEFSCDLNPANANLTKYSGDCTDFDGRRSWTWELVRSQNDAAYGDAGRKVLKSPAGLWHAAQGKKTGEDVRLDADGKLEVVGPDGGTHGSGTWELRPGKSHLEFACANASGRHYSCSLYPKDGSETNFSGRCTFADNGDNWTWELTR